MCVRFLNVISDGNLIFAHQFVSYTIESYNASSKFGHCRIPWELLVSYLLSSCVTSYLIPYLTVSNVSRSNSCCLRKFKSSSYEISSSIWWMVFLTSEFCSYVTNFASFVGQCTVKFSLKLHWFERILSFLNFSRIRCTLRYFACTRNSDQASVTCPTIPFAYDDCYHYALTLRSCWRRYLAGWRSYRITARKCNLTELHVENHSANRVHFGSELSGALGLRHVVTGFEAVSWKPSKGRAFWESWVEKVSRSCSASSWSCASGGVDNHHNTRWVRRGNTRAEHIPRTTTKITHVELVAQKNRRSKKEDAKEDWRASSDTSCVENVSECFIRDKNRWVPAATRCVILRLFGISSAVTLPSVKGPVVRIWNNA